MSEAKKEFKKTYVISNYRTAVSIGSSYDKIKINGAVFVDGAVDERGVTEVNDPVTLEKIKSNWFIASLVKEGEIFFTTDTPQEYEKAVTKEDLATAKEANKALKKQAEDLQKQNEESEAKVKALEEQLAKMKLAQEQTAKLKGEF